MANRNFDTGYCIGKRLIEVAGSFVPLTGAGTVVAANVKGLGFGYAPGAGGAAAGVMGAQTAPVRPGITSQPGVVRTGVGAYSVTYDDHYREINYFSADLGAPAAGSALWAQPVEPWTNTGVLGAAGNIAPSTGITIVNSAGTPTDAAANMRVHFVVQFEDSTVQFQKP